MLLSLSPVPPPHSVDAESGLLSGRPLCHFETRGFSCDLKDYLPSALFGKYSPAGYTTASGAASFLLRPQAAASASL